MLGNTRCGWMCVVWAGFYVVRGLTDGSWVICVMKRASYIAARTLLLVVAVCASGW